MPIMKFSSDEEVVELANDSKYGLGFAVFSGSQHRAKQIASQICSGVAAINEMILHQLICARSLFEMFPNSVSINFLVSMRYMIVASVTMKPRVCCEIFLTGMDWCWMT